MEGLLQGSGQSQYALYDKSHCTGLKHLPEPEGDNTLPGSCNSHNLYAHLEVILEWDERKRQINNAFYQKHLAA
jgi:hypothetical protein